MGIEKDEYLPPRDVIFDEIVGTCAKMWVSMTPEEEQKDYRMEKLCFLANIRNEGADCMFALSQFHPILRHETIRSLSPEAQDFVKYYNQVNENKRSDST